MLHPRLAQGRAAGDEAEATIFVIGSYHNIFRVGAIMQDLGFWILNDIVWRKANPMPNFRGRRFTNAHETLIWAAKSADAKSYTFNYEALKAGNEDCQVRSDWFMPICTGDERLKDAEGRKVHPTQKPEALLRACCSRPPSPATSCSTRSSAPARPARSPGASGGLLSVSSARRTMPRGARASPLSSRCRRNAWRRRPPNVATADRFRERGRMRPHPARDELTDERRRHRAIVRADGSLALGSIVGSIHKVGALAQGLPACNGWTFWHFERAAGWSRSMRCARRFAPAWRGCRIDVFASLRRAAPMKTRRSLARLA